MMKVYVVLQEDIVRGRIDGVKAIFASIDKNEAVKLVEHNDYAWVEELELKINAGNKKEEEGK